MARPRPTKPSRGQTILSTPDPDLAVPPAEPEEESIAALFARLIDHAERFVRAELKLYRATLFDRLTGARTAVISLLTAFLLAQSAIIALLVGLIVILRQPLGAVGATATVVGSALVVAAVLVQFALVKLRKATEIEDKK
ncbi:MAG: phage holin family protein [Sphingomonas sp.]|nr:phage holin family protein [Sphingomonas sp.]